MTLKEFFAEHPKIAIAFSGGTDSAYLAYMAKKYAKEMIAIYVSTAFQPEFEKQDAIRFCEEYKIPLTILERDVLSQEAVVQNPANRCYYCKNVIFTEIQKKALELGFTCLADGTNASDDADDRPGMKALQELHVLSPLRICGITKPALRDVSEQLGLFTARKPAYACLATRIPTGTRIMAEQLQKVEQAESTLMDMGFSDFRVRCPEGYAKLQVKPEQLQFVLEKREEILNVMGPLFGTVCLDLKTR
ncbi:ATP-dependent sacrificial sulfur transferase LarE [Eubacterium ramulus]